MKKRYFPSIITWALITAMSTAIAFILLFIAENNGSLVLSPFVALTLDFLIVIVSAVELGISIGKFVEDRETASKK